MGSAGLPPAMQLMWLHGAQTTAWLLQLQVRKGSGLGWWLLSGRCHAISLGSRMHTPSLLYAVCMESSHFQWIN
jgi:hypothetical protein